MGKMAAATCLAIVSLAATSSPHVTCAADMGMRHNDHGVSRKCHVRQAHIFAVTADLHFASVF